MKMHLDGSTTEIISKTMKGNWGLAGRISQLLQIAKLLSKACWKLMAEDYSADVIGDGPVFTETMLYCNNFEMPRRRVTRVCHAGPTGEH